MKTKKATYILAMTIAVLLAGGCGSSVSAPPVDLPAPITGRIDVSAPDADGNVTVTGSEGAVEGGSLVMVVNESQASASLHLWDIIVPSAYADTFPAICSEDGHSCAYAEDDGSFVVVIPASSEDSLSIGLIDSDTGEWISDRITVTVPQSGEPEPEESCAGLDLTGGVVDVAIAPSTGTPVLLMEGSDDALNQLVIDSGTSSETAVEINGCYAHSLAIKQTSTGDLIAVTSKDDKTIWAGRLDDGELKDTRSMTVSYEPMHLIFIDTASAPIVAMKTSDSVVLQSISLADGTALETMEIYHPDSSTQLTGITRSVKIDALKMDNDEDQYTGLLLTDEGDHVNAFVTLFRADNLTHKLTVQRTDLSLSIDVTESIMDGALFVEWNEYVRVALLDSAADVNSLNQYVITIEAGSVSQPLGYQQDLDDIAEWQTVKLNSGLDASMKYSSLEQLRKIKVSSFSSTVDKAVVVTADGILLKQDLYADTAPSYETDSWASGHSIVAIDLNDDLELLYGADATSEVAVCGSSLLY